MTDRWLTTKEIEYQELKSEADALGSRRKDTGMEAIASAAGGLFMEATAYICFQIDRSWGWQESLFASVGALMLYYSGTRLSEYVRIGHKADDKAFDIERMELEMEIN